MLVFASSLEVAFGPQAKMLFNSVPLFSGLYSNRQHLHLHGGKVSGAAAFRLQIV